MPEISERWQQVYLNLAINIAKASKDPSTKVGAVIYRATDKSVASLGFNGLPPHIPDDPEKLADRAWKLEHTRHAEVNAIDFMQDNVYNTCLSYGMVTTLMPCKNCAEYIINKSPVDIVYCLRASGEVAARWAESFAESKALFERHGIKVIEIDYKPEII